MAEIHQLVLLHGVEGARSMVASRAERKLVDLAAKVLAEESDALGFSYAGFCMTSLPHKRLADTGGEWYRENGRFSLMIEPGKIIRSGGPQLFGVPYGARARMILLYLCTQAVRKNSRRIEIGRSMNAWLGRMGISSGGESYTAVREQANRISACRITIAWRGENGVEGFKRENIIDGMLSVPTANARHHERLWDDEVELTESFFQAMKAHPVPLWEPALRVISNQSLVIDIYVWLTYRLRSVERPQTVSWIALQAQFGPEYTRLRDFRRRFADALRQALAVYPEADVGLDQRGILLRPSPLAVSRRSATSIP
jgi:hypothetical protein